MSLKVSYVGAFKNWNRALFPIGIKGMKLPTVLAPTRRNETVLANLATRAGPAQKNSAGSFDPGL